MDISSAISDFVILGPMSIITLLLISALSYKHGLLIRGLRDLHKQNTECIGGLTNKVGNLEKYAVAMRERDKFIAKFVEDLRGDIDRLYVKMEDVRIEIAKGNGGDHKD